MGAKAIESARKSVPMRRFVSLLTICLLASTIASAHVAAPVKVPPRPRLDVAFILDTTGSMGDEIDVVKEILGHSDIKLTMRYAHIGKAYNNVAHDTEIFGYGTFDASLIFGAPQWDFAPELTITGNNLTDERALVGARFTRISSQELGSLGVDTAARLKVLKVTEPPKRAGGIKVETAVDLVSKLKTEAGGL